MTTIAEVLNGPSDPWGENNDMVTWEIKTLDGTAGIVFRKVDSPALQGGEEVQPNGQTKGGKPKFKVGSAQFGGGSFSGGGSRSASSDKQRSKEQCMRGEAIQASASLPTSTNPEKLFKTAEVIYKWIDGTVDGTATSATPESVSTVAAPPAETEEIQF